MILSLHASKPRVGHHLWHIGLWFLRQTADFSERLLDLVVRGYIVGAAAPLSREVRSPKILGVRVQSEFVRSIYSDWTRVVYEIFDSIGGLHIFRAYNREGASFDELQKLCEFREDLALVRELDAVLLLPQVTHPAQVDPFLKDFERVGVMLENPLLIRRLNDLLERDIVLIDIGTRDLASTFGIRRCKQIVDALIRRIKKERDDLFLLIGGTLSRLFEKSGADAIVIPAAFLSNLPAL